MVAHLVFNRSKLWYATDGLASSLCVKTWFDAYERSKKLCRHGSFIWLQYSGEENTYTGPRRLPASKYKGEKMWTLSVYDFVPLKGVKCRCEHEIHSQMTSSVISQQNYDICGFPGITGCVMTSSVRVLLWWFSQKICSTTAKRGVSMAE